MKRVISIHMQSHCSLLRSALLVGALMLSACGPNLRSYPQPSGERIDGNWVMAEAERERVATALRAALESAAAKEAKRDAARRPRMPGGPGGPSGAGGAGPSSSPAEGTQKGGDVPTNLPLFMVRPPWELREQKEQREALIQMLKPPTQLHIMQKGTTVEFSAVGTAKRRFEAGTRSQLVSTYASFRTESGWQQREFVIHSVDDEQHFSIYERYSRGTDGRLSLHLTFSVPDAKTVDLTVSFAPAG